MPHELMDIQQVARYLDMDAREVEKLASRDRLPGQKRREGWVFRKSDIDHWVEVQMHSLAPGRLAGIEQGVRRHHGMEAEPLLLAPMIPAGGIEVPLRSRTAGGVLRRLVELAEGSGLVYLRDELLAAVEQREQLCSTAIFPGVALPHPRHPLPYDIAASFVTAGLCPAGVPFGAEDGRLTHLFFLVCCKDERTHLHVLARLAQILHAPNVSDRLLTAEDAGQMRDRLVEAEQSVIGK